MPTGFAPRQTPVTQRQQSGAAAILFAVIVIALVLSVGFAMTLGNLYMHQTELRKVAAIAALNQVRTISGCATGAAGSLDGPAADSVDIGQLLADSLIGAEAAAQATFEVIPGVQQSVNSLRVLDAELPPELADAVAVTIDAPMPQSFLPIFSSPESQRMSVTAGAAQVVVGRVVVGSGLLDVDSDQSLILDALLGGLLGSAVNLTVASYNGLLDAQITLLELIEANGAVASVEGLLDLNLQLPGALQLLGDALNASADATDQAAANSAYTLATAASGISQNITLRDYLQVDPDHTEQVARLPINALDLIMGLSMLANEGNDVDMAMPSLVGLVIPGVADVNVNLRLRIVQPPQEGLGRPGYAEDGSALTLARSSQVLALVEVGVRLLPIGSFSLLNLNLDLGVEAGAAEAELASIRCATPAEPFTQTQVFAQSQVGQIGIGNFDWTSVDPIGSAGPSTLLELLGLPLLRVDPAIVVGLGSSGATTMGFDGPFVPLIEEPAGTHVDSVSADADQVLPDAIGSLLGQLLPNLVSNVPVLGLLAPLLQPVVNLATGLLTPLLEALGLVLLNPLFELLGVSVGNAQVTMEAVYVEPPELFELR
nr:hypothetical protein [Oceanococcus sp. HetDA_MAG_MS8]